jgi:nucleotide-binding universal stress UspA family protein
VTVHSSPLIVVGVDGSPPSYVALRWAADAARTLRARLVAVLAWDSPIPSADPRSVRLARDAYGILDEVLDEVRDEVRDLEFDGIVERGEASHVLLHAATRASLLVLARADHAGHSDSSTGAVRRRCAEEAPCPVVVVPAPATQIEATAMTFYLSTTDVRPIGSEPTEFLDLPPMSEAGAHPPAAAADGDPGDEDPAITPRDDGAPTSGDQPPSTDASLASSTAM